MLVSASDCQLRVVESLWLLRVFVALCLLLINRNKWSGTFDQVVRSQVKKIT